MTTRQASHYFEALTDYELMLLQEMCGRNFDYTDESRELLDAFIKMDEALIARGFNAKPKTTKQDRPRQVA
ncbi:hypothetical protein [Alkalimarinus sediminis]|uniref:Uncharacterized protein n=1 Tax=Alkalimarinus sediminis TaxID=1632866 RepID=A0A9E8KN33_9ALTE|nr:hypothetical protein [Alkalimarinus sediminis]UZW73309.1 hypothetical protein NNL22_09605 [Alkalimarinus sediminis]